MDRMQNHYSKKKDDLRVIPKGRLRDNFWNYVERVTGEHSLQRFIWQGSVLTLLSGLPTIWASVLRGKAYKGLLGGLGSSCIIEKNVRFNVPQKIFFGNRVFIGENSYLDARHLESEIRLEDDISVHRSCVLRIFRDGIGKICIREGAALNMHVYIDGDGGVEIGKNSLLSPGVHLFSGNHIFKDPSIPIKFQGTEYGRIEIGEDVWLGTNVIVLPGVSISDGSVVGAGAVVTKDIPSYSIAVGAPAKVVKKRG